MPSAAAVSSPSQHVERQVLSAAAAGLPVQSVFTGLKSSQASEAPASKAARGNSELTRAVSKALCTQSTAASCTCCIQGTKRQSCFHGVNPPAIGMQAYLSRISQHSKSSPICLVMALVYIKRLAQASAHLICQHSIHRLTITSVLLAAKLCDDRVYNNSLYAKIGGISTKELNSMELDLMRRLGYRLMVSVAEVDSQLAALGVSLSDSVVPQPKPRHGQKRAGHAHSPSVELPSKAIEISSSQSHITPPKAAHSSSDNAINFETASIEFAEKEMHVSSS
ncbi:hypothetical protein WJX84_003483 [Apatococcus fuscideae]